MTSNSFSCSLENQFLQFGGIKVEMDAWRSTSMDLWDLINHSIREGKGVNGVKDEDQPVSDSTSSSKDGFKPKPENSTVWTKETEIPPTTTTENEASTAYSDSAEVSTPARKRRKVIFSEEQVTALQDRFQDQKYLKPAEIQSLADEIGLKYTQVMTWFQNNRLKTRKRGETSEREAKRSANKRKQSGNIAPRIQTVQQMMPLASMNQPPQNISFHQAAPQNVPGFVSFTNWSHHTSFLPPSTPTMMNTTPMINTILRYPVAQNSNNVGFNSY